MATKLIYLSILICLLKKCNSINLSQESNQINARQREGKVFSLFTIVNFDNDPCTSTSSLSSGGFRKGTCYTSSECGDKGGTSKGGCASGFGVCCIFLLSDSTSTTVSNNNTYVQNPDFPATYKETSGVSYTVNKLNSDVCFLRLDFEEFTILGPIDSLEGFLGSTSVTTPGGQCTKDSAKITPPSNGGQTVPTICGKNTGQHMYLSMGSQATDTAKIDLSFTDSSNVRKWDICITQLECGSTAPPDGCLQWFNTPSGTFQSFNFLDQSSSHLADQKYSVCFRKELGYCCIKYSVCDESSYPYGFSLDVETGKAADYIAKKETLCTTDYLTIDGAAGTCETNPIAIGLASDKATRYRFCGELFNTLIDTKLIGNTPICDCTAPFEVGVITDKTADVKNDLQVSRGVCLDFQQVSC